MGYKVKQVIVMRTDLMMTKGKMIAQGAHASMKVLLDDAYKTPIKSLTADPTQRKVMLYGLWANEDTRVWLEGSFAKICVRVESKEELLDIVKKAEEAELPTALIVDSGKTMFHGVPTETCCAIGPAKAEDIDKITGHLRLL